MRPVQVRTRWGLLGTQVTAASALSVMALSATACDALTEFGMVTDPGVLQRSASIPAYAVAASSAAPPVTAVVGPLWAAECKYRYNDDTIGQLAALAQLRARAALKGANGIVQLKYMKITNPRSPCWHGFEASGVGVVFAPPRRD